MLCVPTVAILNHDDDTLIFRVFGPEGFKGYCLSGMLSGGAYRHLKEACSAPCNLPFGSPFSGPIYLRFFVTKN
jgi:hypothetical protein